MIPVANKNAIKKHPILVFFLHSCRSLLCCVIVFTASDSWSVPKFSPQTSLPCLLSFCKWSYLIPCLSISPMWQVISNLSDCCSNCHMCGPSTRDLNAHRSESNIEFLAAAPPTSPNLSNRQQPSSSFNQ